MAYEDDRRLYAPNHFICHSYHIMYWYIRTGKSSSLPMKLATDGIRYSKVFVFFLI